MSDKIVNFNLPITGINNSIKRLENRNFNLKLNLSSAYAVVLAENMKTLKNQTEELSIKLMEELLKTIEAVIRPIDAYEHLTPSNLVKVLSYLLTEAQIVYNSYRGTIEYKNTTTSHYWIEIPYQKGKDQKVLTVDLRGRTTFSYGMEDPDIAHGVFKQEDYPEVIYRKSLKVNLLPSKALYKSLIR